MAIRVRPSVVLVAAGLALSGCIDIECPAEIARPASRERWCGHTGNIGAPVTYQTYGSASAVPAPSVVVPPPAAEAPPAPPTAAPLGSVTIQPVPPPNGAPTQIR
jgi:hypothetical protein